MPSVFLVQSLISFQIKSCQYLKRAPLFYQQLVGLSALAGPMVQAVSEREKTNQTKPTKEWFIRHFGSIPINGSIERENQPNKLSIVRARLLCMIPKLIIFHSLTLIRFSKSLTYPWPAFAKPTTGWTKINPMCVRVHPDQIHI